VGDVCCRELTQHGRQGYGFGILGLRAVQAGAAGRAFGSATLLPLSARTGPMALRARQGWQQLIHSQGQQLGAADRWSQLEAKLITLVNSLSLTAAGQVRHLGSLLQQQLADLRSMGTSEYQECAEASARHVCPQLHKCDTLHAYCAVWVNAVGSDESFAVGHVLHQVLLSLA
jgi:hypothetical protein